MRAAPGQLALGVALRCGGDRLAAGVEGGFAGEEFLDLPKPDRPARAVSSAGGGVADFFDRAAREHLGDIRLDAVPQILAFASEHEAAKFVGGIFPGPPRLRERA